MPTKVEYAAVREVARSLALGLIAPAARTAETTRAVPSSVMAELLGPDGLLAISPDGDDWLSNGRLFTAIIEDLAYGDPAIALAATWASLAGSVLARAGQPANPKTLGAGVQPASIAFYEGFGRGAPELSTTVSIADGVVRVTGRKTAVPFLGGQLIVIGRDDVAGTLRAVTIPSDGKGVTVTRMNSGLALGAMQLADVEVATEVGVNALLPESTLGAGGVTALVHRLRLALAAAEIGSGQRAVDYAAKYAVERVAFGRPIAGFQGVSFPLAEAQMTLEAARLEVADLADAVDANPSLELDSSVTEAVNYAGECAALAARDALQTLGGHGFLTDHPVELWYRSTAALSVLDFDPLALGFQAAL